MGEHANSVAPLLVSTEQGYLKSTFCKSLLPAALQRYYMDKVDLTSEGRVERRLAEMGLLNLDEFDKYPPTKMPLLKNLMQMASLSLCKAYQKNYRSLPRIASFIVKGGWNEDWRRWGFSILMNLINILRQKCRC